MNDSSYYSYSEQVGSCSNQSDDPTSYFTCDCSFDSMSGGLSEEDEISSFTEPSTLACNANESTDTVLIVLDESEDTSAEDTSSDENSTLSPSFRKAGIPNRQNVYYLSVPNTTCGVYRNDTMSSIPTDFIQIHDSETDDYDWTTSSHPGPMRERYQYADSSSESESNTVVIELGSSTESSCSDPGFHDSFETSSEESNQSSGENLCESCKDTRNYFEMRCPYDRPKLACVCYSTQQYESTVYSARRIEKYQTTRLQYSRMATRRDRADTMDRFRRKLIRKHRHTQKIYQKRREKIIQIQHLTSTETEGSRQIHSEEQTESSVVFQESTDEYFDVEKSKSTSYLTGSSQSQVAIESKSPSLSAILVKEIKTAFEETPQLFTSQNLKNVVLNYSTTEYHQFLERNETKVESSNESIQSHNNKVQTLSNNSGSSDKEKSGSQNSLEYIDADKKVEVQKECEKIHTEQRFDRSEKNYNIHDERPSNVLDKNSMENVSTRDFDETFDTIEADKETCMKEDLLPYSKTISSNTVSGDFHEVRLNTVHPLANNHLNDPVKCKETYGNIININDNNDTRIKNNISSHEIASSSNSDDLKVLKKISAVLSMKLNKHIINTDYETLTGGQRNIIQVSKYRNNVLQKTDTIISNTNNTEIQIKSNLEKLYEGARQVKILQDLYSNQEEKMAQRQTFVDHTLKKGKLGVLRDITPLKIYYHPVKYPINTKEISTEQKETNNDQNIPKTFHKETNNIQNIPKTFNNSQYSFFMASCSTHIETTGKWKKIYISFEDKVSKIKECNIINNSVQSVRKAVKKIKKKIYGITHSRISETSISPERISYLSHEPSAPIISIVPRNFCIRRKSVHTLVFNKLYLKKGIKLTTKRKIKIKKIKLKRTSSIKKVLMSKTKFFITIASFQLNDLLGRLFYLNQTIKQAAIDGQESMKICLTESTINVHILPHNLLKVNNIFKHINLDNCYIHIERSYKIEIQIKKVFQEKNCKFLDFNIELKDVAFELDFFQHNIPTIQKKYFMKTYKSINLITFSEMDLDRTIPINPLVILCSNENNMMEIIDNIQDKQHEISNVEILAQEMTIPIRNENKLTDDVFLKYFLPLKSVDTMKKDEPIDNFITRDTILRRPKGKRESINITSTSSENEIIVDDGVISKESSIIALDNTSEHKITINSNRTEGSNSIIKNKEIRSAEENIVGNILSDGKRDEILLIHKSTSSIESKSLSKIPDEKRIEVCSPVPTPHEIGTKMKTPSSGVLSSQMKCVFTDSQESLNSKRSEGKYSIQQISNKISEDNLNLKKPESIRIKLNFEDIAYKIPSFYSDVSTVKSDKITSEMSQARRSSTSSIKQYEDDEFAIPKSSSGIFCDIISMQELNQLLKNNTDLNDDLGAGNDFDFLNWISWDQYININESKSMTNDCLSLNSDSCSEQNNITMVTKYSECNGRKEDSVNNAPYKTNLDKDSIQSISDGNETNRKVDLQNNNIIGDPQSEAVSTIIDLMDEMHHSDPYNFYVPVYNTDDFEDMNSDQTEEINSSINTDNESEYSESLLTQEDNGSSESIGNTETDILPISIDALLHILSRGLFKIEDSSTSEGYERELETLSERTEVTNSFNSSTARMMINLKKSIERTFSSRLTSFNECFQNEFNICDRLRKTSNKIIQESGKKVTRGIFEFHAVPLELTVERELSIKSRVNFCTEDMKDFSQNTNEHNIRMTNTKISVSKNLRKCTSKLPRKINNKIPMKIDPNVNGIGVKEVEQKYKPSQKLVPQGDKDSHKTSPQVNLDAQQVTQTKKQIRVRKNTGKYSRRRRLRSSQGNSTSTAGSSVLKNASKTSVLQCPINEHQLGVESLGSKTNEHETGSEIRQLPSHHRLECHITSTPDIRLVPIALTLPETIIFRPITVSVPELTLGNIENIIDISECVLPTPMTILSDELNVTLESKDKFIKARSLLSNFSVIRNTDDNDSNRCHYSNESAQIDNNDHVLPNENNDLSSNEIRSVHSPPLSTSISDEIIFLFNQRVKNAFNPHTNRSHDNPGTSSLVPNDHIPFQKNNQKLDKNKILPTSKHINLPQSLISKKAKSVQDPVNINLPQSLISKKAKSVQDPVSQIKEKNSKLNREKILVPTKVCRSNKNTLYNLKKNDQGLQSKFSSKTSQVYQSKFSSKTSQAKSIPSNSQRDTDFALRRKMILNKISKTKTNRGSRANSVRTDRSKADSDKK